MHMSFKSLVAVAAALMAATGAQAGPATGLLNNALFDFDTATAGVSNQRAVTGVAGVLTAIDYRPATGALYGLSSAGGLYTIDVTTGVASLASVLSSALSGTTFDIAFNPTVDRLRIVSDTGQNLRVNVDTGAVTTDGTLNRGGVTATGIVAAAYTNQVPGATATTLYDIDGSGTGSLNIQAPPNDGTLTTVGPTLATLTSFDIDGLGNTGYASNGSVFGTVNLATGAFTQTGSFGVSNVADFAIRPAVTTVPEPLSLALLGTGIAGVALLRRRRVTPEA